MRNKDPRDWMWAEAMGLLQTAGRLQRQFFHVGGYQESACWAPPVDIYETGDGLWILVALPGVAPGDLSVGIEGASIVVSGERPLPVESRRGAIHRLEIPYGRFERRITLPEGRFELMERQLERGCLILGLRRLD